MHTNSLAVHQENLKERKYPKQIVEIVESLKFLQSGTMHQIAKHMGKELNCISGRFKRMREDGLIKESGTTEKRRTIWTLK